MDNNASLVMIASGILMFISLAFGMIPLAIFFSVVGVISLIISLWDDKETKVLTAILVASLIGLALVSLN